MDSNHKAMYLRGLFYFRLAGVIIDTARCQIIPMGLNLFKLTASRSFIGGGNYG